MIGIMFKITINVHQRRSGRFEPVLVGSLRGEKIDRRNILSMHWNRSIQVGKCVVNISVMIGCQGTHFRFIHDYDLLFFPGLGLDVVWNIERAQKRSHRGGNLTTSGSWHLAWISIDYMDIWKGRISKIDIYNRYLHRYLS
jgi:hypothetical protein